jgi:peptidoglycan/LPS O-acetylase OafA/YrhL
MSAGVSFTSRRDPALDGFRGLMTLLVLVSHYLAEIDGGFHRGALGFVAVDGFFVLSGLLVGRLVLEKGAAGNFMAVFYLRRVFRTFPIYFVCLAAGLAAAALVGLPGDDRVPAWSYFAFVNNIYSAVAGDIGREWLSPNWTMAVEEQFYLVAPSLLLFTPRRARLPMLGAVVAFAIVSRAILMGAGASGEASTMLLISRADCLAIGLAAAVLLNGGVDWTRRLWLSLALTVLALALGVLFGAPAMVLVGHTLICAALAIYLMAVAQGAPERQSLDRRLQRYCGDTSYAIYLTHMPVLWLAHALIRHSAPTLGSLSGVLVTLMCAPIVFALAHVLTRYVEAPITAIGRSFQWRPPLEPANAARLREQGA